MIRVTAMAAPHTPSVPRLASSRSKQEFFRALGLSTANDAHNRLYNKMKVRSGSYLKHLVGAVRQKFNRCCRTRLHLAGSVRVRILITSLQLVDRTLTMLHLIPRVKSRRRPSTGRSSTFTTLPARRPSPSTTRVSIKMVPTGTTG